MTPSQFETWLEVEISKKKTLHIQSEGMTIHIHTGKEWVTVNSSKNITKFAKVVEKFILLNFSILTQLNENNFHFHFCF